MSTGDVEEGKAKQNNGMTGVLTTLASSSNAWVQLATVGMIALSGFGNWLATKQDGEESRGLIKEEREKVVRQVSQITDEVHEMYRQFEGTIDRQKENVRLVKSSIENQTQMLQNQTRMLEGQNKAMEADARILHELARAMAPATIERAYPTPSLRQ